MCYTNAMKIRHNKERMIKQLLDWYDSSKRSLPWRDHPTPYAVWVSEIMLQQTRVEAVKPYFHRFMSELPTLQCLAECDDERLIKLWEGLGYYNRVRNMKKCALICMERYNCKLPSDPAQLLQLPGIGLYTAGAIASIAYRIPVCAVDGNVMRVFSRVLYLEDDIASQAVKNKFSTIIQEYIPKRCDAFNQALMELGALICIPNGVPHCEKCPIQSECIAYQRNDVMRLPIKKAKKQRMIEQHTVLILVYQNQVHLMKRPSQGLLANLYQFDFMDGYYEKNEILQYCGTFAQVKDIYALSPAKHNFTHKEWHMQGWLVFLDSFSEKNGLWCSREELINTYAIASAFQKYKDIALNVLSGAYQNES